MRILCAGLTPAWQEVLEFERLVPGRVNRAIRVNACSAGKGVNVARVLRQLGESPVLLGFAGGDTGRRLVRDVAGDGVGASMVRTATSTRVCRTLIDHSSGRVTELVEESALPSRGEWRRFHASYAASLRTVRFVVIAGAPMPGAPATVYGRLVREAASAGVPVLIDARREPLRAALAFHPLVVKLNRSELEATLRRSLKNRTALLAGCRTLIREGAVFVVVTDGPRGAWAMTAAESWYVVPPRIRAVNAIGSGDAMDAGIVSGMVRGLSFVDSVRLGVACGAANALTLLPGHVRRVDVRRLLRLTVASSVGGEQEQGRTDG